MSQLSESAHCCSFQASESRATHHVPSLNEQSILIPQLYLLRLLQSSLGAHIDGLLPHVLGLTAPAKLHHVSVSSSRTDGRCSYRARTCGNCSKDGKRVDLGTYACLGDALLVNDMWQLLYGDPNRAHTLLPGDESWVQHIYVLKIDRQSETVVCVAELFMLGLHLQPSSASSSAPVSPAQCTDHSYGSPSIIAHLSFDADDADMKADLLQDERKGTKRAFDRTRTTSFADADTDLEGIQSPRHKFPSDATWERLSFKGTLPRRAGKGIGKQVRRTSKEVRRNSSPESDRTQLLATTGAMLEALLNHNVLWGTEIMQVLSDAQTHDALSSSRTLVAKLFAKDGCAPNAAMVMDMEKIGDIKQWHNRFRLDTAQESAQAAMLRLCVASLRTLPENLIRYLLKKLDNSFDFNAERLPMELRARSLSDFCASCEQNLSHELHTVTADAHRQWHLGCSHIDICVVNCWTELWLLLGATETSGDLAQHLLQRSMAMQRVYNLLDGPRGDELGCTRTKQRLVLLQINYIAALAFVCDVQAYIQTLLQFATETAASMEKELHVLPQQIRLLMQASLLRLFLQHSSSEDPTTAAARNLVFRMDEVASELYHTADAVFTAPLETLSTAPILALTQAEARLVCLAPLVLYFTARETDHQHAHDPAVLCELNSTRKSSECSNTRFVHESTMLLTYLHTSCSRFSLQCVWPHTLAAVRSLEALMRLCAVQTVAPRHMELLEACTSFLELHSPGPVRSAQNRIIPQVSISEETDSMELSKDLLHLLEPSFVGEESLPSYFGRELLFTLDSRSIFQEVYEDTGFNEFFNLLEPGEV